ncbi:ABC-type multidrug transport system, ATPase and permease component [Actinoalloteichus hymeniacidonis]|uniref:ABC-type multidrug transport system, ATPase and permease component n=2 Tax=Actinoalloteichus hymeniacidonis TaxID=340345 RepID=A0AAC9HQ74_9PSEU|nr:ABC-type multidrug transport system, ATPase and permease component [Actinoalloteichus hymeniacidonis]
MLCLMLPAYLLSRAVDDGLRAGDLTALSWWTASILAITLINALLGLMRHRTMTLLRMDVSLRTVQLVTRHTTRLGAALSRKVTTGEVVTIGATDLTHIGHAMTALGPGLGAVAAYLGVAAVLLSISPLLAVVVLLGVPLLCLAVGPLLNRLQTTQTRYREQQGALSNRAGDIVAGLRVLCGIGGKDEFAHRYRTASAALQAEGMHVSAVSSWIQALSTGLPSLFLIAVTWLAARMVIAGEITVGEMIAVYGYVAALIVPVYFLIEGAGDLASGLVACRRVTAVLALTPLVDDHPDPLPGPTEPAVLHDPESGVTIAPGSFTVLVTARRDEALPVMDRLARRIDSESTWGDTPLNRMSLTETRSRILLADDDAYLFAGTLRDIVTAGRQHDDDTVTDALHTAAADDILLGLPHGLDSTVQTQGRDLSGGQQQRLRLSRAVLAEPEVLLLVEPTSAVDAHTEAAIARRLHTARTGSTTLVATTSPLMLDHADQVVLLDAGRVHATGDHRDLLATNAHYRRLVQRDDDQQPITITHPEKTPHTEGAAR